MSNINISNSFDTRTYYWVSVNPDAKIHENFILQIFLLKFFKMPEKNMFGTPLGCNKCFCDEHRNIFFCRICVISVSVQMTRIFHNDSRTFVDV
jgi:hypothetical protein